MPTGSHTGYCGYRSLNTQTPCGRCVSNAFLRGWSKSIPNDGYAFFLNSATQFVRHGLTVREIAIHFRDRGDGVSKISKGEIVRAIITLIWLTLDRRPATSN